jgi:hypothetical protein
MSFFNSQIAEKRFCVELSLEQKGTAWKGGL